MFLSLKNNSSLEVISRLRHRPAFASSGEWLDCGTPSVGPTLLGQVGPSSNRLRDAASDEDNLETIANLNGGWGRGRGVIRGQLAEAFKAWLRSYKGRADLNAELIAGCLPQEQTEPRCPRVTPRTRLKNFYK